MTDPAAQVAQEWLSTLLRHCGLVVNISTALPEAALTRLNHFGGYWLTLAAADMTAEQQALLLDNNGQVLDALQYLVNATLNLSHRGDGQAAYTVELSGFREQRYLELAQMAEDVAQEVRQTGAAVAMVPLPPAERRLIHMLLAEAEDLETHSQGQEPQRCLVVGPKQTEGTASVVD
jgi:spoIIIJ-associated protein